MYAAIYHRHMHTFVQCKLYRFESNTCSIAGSGSKLVQLLQWELNWLEHGPGHVFIQCHLNIVIVSQYAIYICVRVSFSLSLSTRMYQLIQATAQFNSFYVRINVPFLITSIENN